MSNLKSIRSLDGRVARGQQGQSVVEFAVVLPVLLALIMGIFEFSMLLQSASTVQHAADEAARYAVTGAAHDLGAGVREENIVDIARNAAGGIRVDEAAGPTSPGHFRVVIRSSTSDGSTVNDAGRPNDFVRVEVFYNYPMQLPILNTPFAYIGLQAEALGINERYRRAAALSSTLPVIPPR